MFKNKKFNDLGLEKADNLEPWLLNRETEEGQLSIDVYQSGDRLIVKSTIAGARPEDIEVILSDDALVIRGCREMDEFVEHHNYLYRECYWGKFSRTIILPFEVDEEKVEVDLERGVLTIVLPKAQRINEITFQPSEI